MKACVQFLRCQRLTRPGLLLGLFSLLLMMGLLATPAQAQDDMNEIPRGVGFPVEIGTSGFFNEISEINDGAGTYTASVDLRFRWQDLRQAFQSAVVHRDRIVLMQDEASEQLKRMWHPPVEITNLAEAPQHEESLLTIQPDGKVEWIWRVEARFKSGFEVSHFPFDRQKLNLDLRFKKYNDQLLVFSTDQQDQAFAGMSSRVEVPGWRFGLLDFVPSSHIGLEGAPHSQLGLAVNILRQPEQYFWPIFVPIFAVMIVPVLAIWLNTFDGEEFKVESFELVNMIIGGLFAVIALNFTINSGFPALANGDNTIVRLFGLNYLLIAMGLVINIVVFKSQVVFQWLGKYRIEQLYHFLCWSIPVFTVTMVAAIVGVALP